MISDYLFLGFCTNRNIKDSTIKSYRSAILKYESFHKMAMDDLIGEAIKEDESLIPLKNRCTRGDCWISGLFYWILICLSAL